MNVRELRELYAAVLGRVLVHVRTRAGRSQQTVEAATGISQSSLSRFENAQSIPDLYEVTLLVREYDESTAGFVDLVERVYSRARQVGASIPLASKRPSAVAELGLAAEIEGMS